MNLWILDTDHVSLFQRGHPDVIERVTQTAPADIAITIVTAEELIRGWLAVIRRAKTVDALGKGYTQLGKTIAFCNTIQVINFDQAAQQVYAELKTRQLRIGTQDLRIAAIALASNSTVVTRNHKDFGKVPDVSLADWTIR